MHLEKQILEGKHFKKGELKKEAVEELDESEKGRKIAKKLGYSGKKYDPKKEALEKKKKGSRE